MRTRDLVQDLGSRNRRCVQVESKALDDRQDAFGVDFLLLSPDDDCE